MAVQAGRALVASLQKEGAGLSDAQRRRDRDRGARIPGHHDTEMRVVHGVAAFAGSNAATVESECIRAKTEGHERGDNNYQAYFELHYRSS
jgi:hypothetical protein